MPRIKLEQVVHETAQGTYRTRHPQNLVAVMERKATDELSDSELDRIAKTLPNIFKGNQARLREGAHLEEPTLLERVDRSIPLLDLKGIPYLAVALGAAALTWHVAKYGGDATSIYHGIHQAVNSVTPEWLSNGINAVNKQLFFLKGDSYPNAAVIGMLSTVAMGYGLVKGLIPWRGDQISWKKSHVAELEQLTKDGLRSAPYVGHVVGFGMRDPLVATEMKDGKSFTRHLRAAFGNVVLAQRDSGYWRPKNLGIEFNDDGMYVNLPFLLAEGTPLPEILSPAIRSGAYQAGGIIINGQREFELFEDTFVDTFNDGDRPNFALGAYLVRNANLLRNLVFEEAPPLRTSVIVPQYLSPKEGFRKEGDSWRYTVQANFMTPGAPSIDGVIVPEKVFLEMVYDTLQQRDALGKTIYIDTEGENDARGKAERCKVELTKLYQSRGIAVPEMITDYERADDADVSIMLRGRNRFTRQSVAINRFEHNHDLVLYATTQREDTLAHQNPSEARRRIPVPYKQQIAQLALEHLTGRENPFSLTTLLDNGTLQRYK